MVYLSKFFKVIFSRSVVVKNENIKATSVAVLIQFFTTYVY